jgi:hypothetical protein
MNPNDQDNESQQSQLTHEERQYAMFCHFSAFLGLLLPFGSIIGPLVLWQIKKDESSFIDYHGKEALNFNITMAIVTLMCVLLMLVFIGFVLIFIAMMVWLVLIIIAGVKANDGLYYRYPFCIRIIY